MKGKSREKKEENGKKKSGCSFRYTQATVIEAIRGTGGLVTQIAGKLGCSPRTVSNYIQEFPKVKEAYDNEKESVLDMAEGALYGLIPSGDASAIFYYLNNKGKGRGYNAQSKAWGAGGGEAELETGKTGVLVKPGLLEEDAWEKAAKNTAKKTEKSE